MAVSSNRGTNGDLGRYLHADETGTSATLQFEIPPGCAATTWYRGLRSDR